MRVRIKQLVIQNFKGCKSRRIEFSGKDTTISGANATGKTTVVDAFFWLLFGKDSAGNEKFNIRPLNKEGTQIDNLEIKVSALLDVDGTEKEFTKTQKQKWVKSRTTGETTLQGNVNEFEIDGYPVKNEKAYKEAAAEIINEDLFKMLTNPTCFPAMDWKKQREILMQFVGNVSDVELAERKSEFAPIIPELKKAPSLDDMKQKYQKKAKEIGKELDAFPVRIETLENQKVDVDLSALELQRNALKEQISDAKKQISSTDKQFEEYQKLSDGILELKFSLSDLERKASEENQKKKKDLENKIKSVGYEVDRCNETLELAKKKIETCEKSVAMCEEEITETRKKWTSANAMQFDEGSKFCELCGQQLPEEKISELVSEFEQRKKSILADIEQKGNNLKNQIDTDKTCIVEYKSKIAVEENRKLSMRSEIENYKRQLSDIPDAVDISGTDEYKEIQKQISEKEVAMSQMNNASDIRNDYMEKLDGLQNELIECEKSIAFAVRNNDLDAEIEQIQKEQREKGQEQAECDRMLYILENFIKFKMETVQKQIKESLGSEISVKLLEQQLNGEIKPTCKLTVNGVPFNDLNNGHKIIAGLNMIKTLQKLYDTYLPVFVDNAESINESNLPEMQCQIIKLKVSDDKELVIAEG